MGLEKIEVRSPMTCDAPLGVCALCYGMDLSTGKLVELGMAVGIIAALARGEPHLPLTIRTYHIGGVAARHVEESEIKARRQGVVKFARMKVVRNDAGQHVVLTRNGEIVILDPNGREFEKCEVPAGAILAVTENHEVMPGDILCQWDPHAIHILAEVRGTVRFEDIVEDVTLHTEKTPNGPSRRIIMEHRGDLHPQIVLQDGDGKTLDVHYLPEGAQINVAEGDQISAGTLLAKTPRKVSGTQDIPGGRANTCLLSRLMELFEARKPKDPAVLAEIDGIVELLGEKRRGMRVILVRSKSGIKCEHLVSYRKQLRVHHGSLVRAGEALVNGPLDPHDILHISGEEEVQKYLTREIQNVYRSQRVKINDKHIEIIVSQMLHKVRVESTGDTTLLSGSIMDRFKFRTVNQELAMCLKISHKGDSDFEEGSILPLKTLEYENARIEAFRGDPAKGFASKPAIASTQLLGITETALRSSSFISAATLGKATDVLTEAALAGKTDWLAGLKENVILGRLIPAGTGFPAHKDSEVHIRTEAIEGLLAEST